MQNGYKNIEDYGIIGNLDTCALVSNDGSIDWLPVPHLESPSIFASILDSGEGGSFSIQPSGHFTSKQRYIEHTNVLQTHFTTSEGTLDVTDFMLPLYEEGVNNGKRWALFRKINCEEGMVDVNIDFKPRFNYAGIIPLLVDHAIGLKSTDGEFHVYLQTDIEFELEQGGAQTRRTFKKGDEYWLILMWGDDSYVPFSECENILAATIRYWRKQAHVCETDPCLFEGPWHELVIRSGLTLKLLTHPSTGAIAAAPTTSLPEEIGGVRNWDYRFAWIRDASFTIQALYNIGYRQPALDYFHWIHNICSAMENPETLRILYTLHGEYIDGEEVIGHLTGYKNSKPVRIGNAAAVQKQHDIYGELISAYYDTVRYERDLTEIDWKMIRLIADHVCQIWNTPDSGIWEVRSEPKHFTYSKLMCWVALDRSIRLAEHYGFTCPLETWKSVRDDIREAILTQGFNPRMNSFVQAFGEEYLDATSLLIPVLGFLQFDDPRVQGTLDATIQYLSNDGFVFRYNGPDGVTGGEGAFVLCTFWLVDALALSGRIDEAEEMFKRVLSYASPLGLIAEEIDPITGNHLGNYPQGFSHIGLINSALYIGKAKGREQVGPEPIGVTDENEIEK
jgi:alpha,alpha-trehalase